MNFILLEVLMEKRKDLTTLIKNLKNPTYGMLLYKDYMTFSRFPPYIDKKLKEFALDECEKELKCVEKEIENLK